MGFQTLMTGTRRFRLADPSITNSDLAAALKLGNSDSDAIGVPFCFFLKDGYVAMVRITDEVVGVFHTFQSVAHQIDAQGLGSATAETVQFA